MTVTMADYRASGACVITVDDDGPGHRSRRPDAGVRALLPGRPRAQPPAGSGLGLAIVAELAAAMGGTVRAESPLGYDGGSRFVVTLRYWSATGGARRADGLSRGHARPAAASHSSGARNRGVYGSSMMDVQEAIRNAPLFSQLSKKDIKQLAAAMNPRTFPAGAVIIEKGKPGMGFFVIASGSATRHGGGEPGPVAQGR